MFMGSQFPLKPYMNPVIPGDHPDPTLTRIGNDFYTTGSSFNPYAKIYHSTDLVHWEVISQPVSASWSTYGDSPARYMGRTTWFYITMSTGTTLEEAEAACISLQLISLKDHGVPQPECRFLPGCRQD